MGRSSWSGKQKFTIHAVGAAIVSATITLDSKQDLHLKAKPFLALSTPPSFPNNTFNSDKLDCPELFYCMESSMKTMLGASTNKAVTAAIHPKCNMYPIFKNLVSHYPKTSYFCHPKSYNLLLCPKSAYFDPKRMFFGVETTYFCLYPSGYFSCLQSLPNNPEFSPFLRRIHENNACHCLSSICQDQCQGLNHFYLSSKPWVRRNTLSYLRLDSLYSLQLGSPNSLPFSKSSLLGSIFSSLISTSVSSLPFSFLSSPSTTDKQSFHLWHCPKADGDGDGGEGKKFSPNKKPVMTVVLLGWLGAQQKHLKKYADWYNSRGIHAVTFVVPVKDLVGFKPGGKVEQHIQTLARELGCWMSGKEDDGRERWLMFHTFSNTGWLSYGVILEKLLTMGNFYEKIKGCVVDSAPEPEPNPQVWALGFLAALLKKRSHLLHSAYENGVNNMEKDADVIKPKEELDPPFSEVALLAILEKLFSVLLKHPYVYKRLSEVTSILSQHQPPCPQLYIYSSADKVIPAASVESFIEEQKKTGKKVKAYNMQSSPHVDHFRTFPRIYTDQLRNFLEECTQIVNQ